MPVLHALSSSICDTTYQLDTVSPARRYYLLFTSENAVKENSVIKITKVPLCTSFNRAHLIVLTISVITARQLNVNI